MTTTEKVRPQPEISIARRVSTVMANRAGRPSRITADASGAGPTEFELLKIGMWRTPNHGDIMITPDDLLEYVENNKAGFGVSGDNSLKLPINYGHESDEKAAGWFNLEVRGDTLWAIDVEWTPAGAQALVDGEWKCISAEFYPAGRGGWPDPLDWEHYVVNVIDGAALTNIPLFSQLKPVMASALAGEGAKADQNQVFFITASQNKESKSMTLEEIRAKEFGDLSAEEKTFMTEHKDELSADERVQYGLEAAPAPAADPHKKEEEPEVPKPNEDTSVPAAVAASLRSGESVVIKASTLKGLEDTATQYRTEKAETIVKAHIARGAIVADQLDDITKRVLADPSFEDVLKALPVNPVLASTQGSDKNAGQADSAIEELDTKVKEEVKASEGKKLYADVQKEILSTNKDLAERVNAERAS